MKKTLIALAATAMLSACASSKGPMAMAMLHPSGSQTARGSVHFQDAGDQGVEVKVDLVGVPPGVHGFHVHEGSECGANGTAAGAHFNPSGMPHGAPEAVSHHAGDFGNVTADDKGEIHTTFYTHSVSLKEGQSTYVVGRAVILHAKADDLTSQPSGNAGDRIACGIATVMDASMHH